VACFSSQKSTLFLTTNYHTSHHDLTIKNHVQHPTFSKTPSKNARKNLKTGSTGASDFFMKLAAEF
jgi:hypothetical protein